MLMENEYIGDPRIVSSKKPMFELGISILDDGEIKVNILPFYSGIDEPCEVFMYEGIMYFMEHDRSGSWTAIMDEEICQEITTAVFDFAMAYTGISDTHRVIFKGNDADYVDGSEEFCGFISGFIPDCAMFSKEELNDAENS